MGSHKQQVVNPDHTDHIKQGKALVRAIEGLGAIEPTSGPLERALVRLLLAIYARRLRAIVLTLVPSAQL
ncbi:MAG: hypothetical protein ACE5OS_09905 [Anaerolineae bacterium]